eukprot:c15458_g1_i1.p1 GENE.c15458_g1_i1~~c15458_g1_i1.p1  ORF type:complete len:662 (+),score=139.74 c15458_g1_i1:28-2013(+)
MEVVKEGWLSKTDTKSRWIKKGSSMRYFVLTKETLTWFKDPQDTDPVNSIPVASYFARNASEEMSWEGAANNNSNPRASFSTEMTELDCMLVLVPKNTDATNTRGTGAKTYVLACSSTEERDEWVRAFQHMSLRAPEFSVPRTASSLHTSRSERSTDGDTSLVNHASRNSFSRTGGTSGYVVGWGRNTHGQLGSIEWPRSKTGTPVIPSMFEQCSTAIDVACGDKFAVVLVTSDTGASRVLMMGALTDTDKVMPPTPLPSLDSYSITSVACGSSHVLALAASGQVYAWGTNMYGQCGLGSTAQLRVTDPQPTCAKLPPCRLVAAGGNTSAAISLDGDLWVWGANAFGQCTDASLQSVLQPTLVRFPTQTVVHDVAIGLVHALAVCGDGAVYSWGCALDGRLGHDRTTEAPPDTTATDGFPECACEPFAIPKLAHKGVERVFAGDCHSCALTSTGKMYTWGLGENGQLGRNENISFHPVSLRGVRFATACCGGNFTIGITDGGVVQAWGKGRDGVLGQGPASAFTDSHQPLIVTGLAGTKAAHVAAGLNFCFAIVVGDPNNIAKRLGGKKMTKANSGDSAGNSREDHSECDALIERLREEIAELTQRCTRAQKERDEALGQVRELQKSLADSKANSLASQPEEKKPVRPPPLALKMRLGTDE